MQSKENTRAPFHFKVLGNMYNLDTISGAPDTHIPFIQTRRFEKSQCDWSDSKLNPMRAIDTAQLRCVDHGTPLFIVFARR